MILVLEIAMIVIGLIALFSGKFTISKSKVVTGAAARLLGLLALTPLPVAFVAVALYVAASDARNPEQFVEDNKLTITLIEAGIVIVIAIALFGIGAAIGHPPVKKRSRRDEEDDYEDEEDDRPRKRRSRRDEEEDEYEEDDRPKKRRNRRDEEYDDE